MSESSLYHNRIFSKVETVCCKCASRTTGNKVDVTEMYIGKTKTSLVVSVARSLALMIMHDTYGITYRKIARRANMSEKAVMKSVAKARIYRFSDQVYNRAYELIMAEL